MKRKILKLLRGKGLWEKILEGKRCLRKSTILCTHFYWAFYFSLLTSSLLQSEICSRGTIVEVTFISKLTENCFFSLPPTVLFLIKGSDDEEFKFVVFLSNAVEAIWHKISSRWQFYDTLFVCVLWLALPDSMLKEVNYCLVNINYALKVLMNSIFF